MGILSNAKWVALSQSIKILVILINLVVLARLIPPADFGLMAMALVVVNLANLIRDFGTSAAIIQRQSLSDKTINAVFWLNVIVGGLLLTIIIVFSPVISYVFNEPRLITILCLLSISFPIACSSSTHLALLEKKSKFKRIAFIEVSSSLIAVTGAIILAYKNFGVYSLVFQAITSSVLSAVQIWIASRWRPNFSNIIDISEIKNIFGFSGNLTAFNFINYFSRNADTMIIGYYMSASILGAYSLAYRIMLFPIQNLTFVASRALFPIFSENQDNNPVLKKTYLNAVYFILLIVLPLMVGLATLSRPFVNLVFGQQWFLVGELLKWLAPTAIIQSVLSSTGVIFMTKGRTDILLKLGVFSTVLQVLAFIIGVHFGIVNFAKIYFFANIINFIPVMFLVMKLIDGSIIELLKKTYTIVIHSAIMAFALILCCEFLPYFNSIESFIKLVLISLLGCGIYVSLIFLTEFAKIKEFKSKPANNIKSN
ncbi:TPA: MOP flippase family protein [Klebsiella michiganensis]